MSKTTFYKLVDSGLINIRNIDLERKVKLKLKYKKIKRETVKKNLKSKKEELIEILKNTYQCTQKLLL